LARDCSEVEHEEFVAMKSRYVLVLALILTTSVSWAQNSATKKKPAAPPAASSKTNQTGKDGKVAKPGPVAKPAASGKAAPAAKGGKSKETPGAKPAAAPAKGSGDKFDSVMTEWKALLTKLRDLRMKYATTQPADQAPIEEEYLRLVDEGEQLEQQLIAAAEATLASGSSQQDAAGKFLAQLLKSRVQQDDYENALPIAKALIDNDYDNSRIYNYAGLAAFCTGDFEDARKWLEEGDQHAVLDVASKQFLQHFDQYKKLWDKEQEIREQEAQADDLPRVLFKTNKGDIVLELFENEAPNTVANFIHLVQKGFFDGTVFHRVMPGFMAQGGSPDGTLSGTPGYSIPDEQNEPNRRNHFRGSISMANSGPNSGGSQFFLMFRPSGPAAAAFDLNGRHAVFGRIIKGIDVLAKLRRTVNEKDEPNAAKPDKIIEATVVRKRDHDYVPRKVGDPIADANTDDAAADADAAGADAADDKNAKAP
jgi:cyclophilin family peptidyl-prolyl cis-trans isomerase